jgi:hypothetical protein
MGYILCVDEVQIPITNFAENLNDIGILDFNVSSTNLRGGDISTFKNLTCLKSSINDGHLELKVKDDIENVVIWESSDYMLQNASLNANESGIYFSAYFVIADASDDLDVGASA